MIVMGSQSPKPNYLLFANSNKTEGLKRGIILIFYGTRARLSESKGNTPI